MSLLIRYAQFKIPAFSGVWPGSDRNLDELPLELGEIELIKRLKAMTEAGQKRLDRHGLAFDKATFTQWKEHTAAPNEVPAPTRSAYVGNWYECVDCKERDPRAGIRLARNSGEGTMIGQEVEYYPPGKSARKRTVRVYCGWLCNKCLAKRQISAREAQQAMQKKNEEPLLEHVGQEVGA